MTTLWINQAWPVMFTNVGHDAYWILVGINLIGLIVVVLFWPIRVVGAAWPPVML